MRKRRARRPRPRRARRADAAQAMAELRAARMLIVDDDMRNIYSLASVLEAHGVEVLHAERGAEGIPILETDAGDRRALVDIMMPEMDGYETMRRIRANPESPTFR